MYDSKKDDATRKAELIAQLGNELMVYCAENVSTLIRDKFGFAVLLETLLHGEGDRASVIKNVIKLAKNSPDTEDHVMSNPVASRFIKTLVVTDLKYQEEAEG